MYAIIEFRKDKFGNDAVFPILNGGGSLKLFDKLSEADDEANNYANTDDFRVISIQSVEV